MAILSIQSQVACGHVGNSAAIFALQRLGREVWAVPTMLLSHHPGHGGAAGGALPSALLNRILDGLGQHGCFSRCDAVLSGYLGAAASAEAVARAVALAKSGTKGAVYLCDPVLGDDGRLYVAQPIVTAMHNLAAKADMMTPNEFELSVLTGHACATRKDALEAMRILQGKGPRIVVLTGFAGAGRACGMLEMLAVDGADAWVLGVPDLGRKFHGAGDLFAALFLDAWLERRETRAALEAATGAVHAVLARTAERQSDELVLIGKWENAAPARQFPAERMA
jgi:pyridoxine kinase